jgi:hypothetical protein
MTDENQPEPTPEPPADDLGDAGKKALKAERDRAAAAERQLRTLQAQYDEATSRVTAFEVQVGDLTKQVSERELANTRLTVAIEKNLPLKFADRLRGTTPEEIAADADEIVQALPQPTAGGATTSPKPDPSQGARGPGKSSPNEQFAAALGEYFTT